MWQQTHHSSFKADEQRLNEGGKHYVQSHQGDNDHRGMAKHIPAKARDKEGLSSEHYHRAVAEMAYGFWEARGHTHGAADADWIKAEAALKPLWSADLSFASMDATLDSPAIS